MVGVSECYLYRFNKGFHLFIFSYPFLELSNLHVSGDKHYHCIIKGLQLYVATHLEH